MVICCRGRSIVRGAMYVKRGFFVLLCLALGVIYYLLNSDPSLSHPEFVDTARQATKEFAGDAKKAVGDFILNAQMMAVRSRALRRRDRILSLLLSPVSISAVILSICVITCIVFIVAAALPESFMNRVTSDAAAV